MPNTNIENVKHLLGKLIPVCEGGCLKGEVINSIELLTDEDQLQERFCQLIESAKEGVIVLCRSPLVEDREKAFEQMEFEKESLARGVKGKCIYEMPDTLEEVEWLRGHVNIVSALGEDARIANKLPMQFAIIDMKTIVFQLEDTLSFKPASTHVVIHHRSLAQSLEMLFNAIWLTSAKIDKFDSRIEEFWETQTL